jgi:hypothetical protein
MSNSNWQELHQEYIPCGEEEEIELLLELSKFFHDKQREAINQYRRGQHTKDTGCVKAQFIIEPELPENLKYGVFRETKTFEAIVRFSNSSSIPDPDKKPNGRGMAIKLLGVEGEKVLPPGDLSESADRVQDFIMVNHPTFPFADVNDYHMLFSDMKAVGPEKARQQFAQKYPKKGEIILAIIQKTVSNPLNIQYWSESPYRLGTQAMKFSTKPQVEHTTNISQDNDNFLFQAAAETLKEKEVSFDFLVQLQTDPQTTPIEDVSIEWNSPFTKVATVKILQQDLDSPEMQSFRSQCESFFWNPWHALVEHKPIGGINRLRKKIYLASAERRLQQSDRS